MNRNRLIWAAPLALSACVLAGANSSVLTQTQRDSVKVLTPDDVAYVPLNPARGDRSPRAGVLWGDIRSSEASGVLLRFADGFSSPPHIHNITYRAIVISGQLHNDDPDAAELWMGPGSFWTQPAGENHITAARTGSDATAFLEILSGPYLVQPADDQFDNGERPINLLHANLVWLGADDFAWIEAEADADGAPQAALLWGDLRRGLLSGSMIRLPGGFAGSLLTEGGNLRSVVIDGDVVHSVPSVTPATRVGAGGFFESAADVAHVLMCQSEQDCLIYVRTEGVYRLR